MILTTSWVFSAFLDWRIYLTICVLYLVYFYTKVLFSGLPPGPIPYPIVGNIPQLGAQMHLSLPELGKKYKDVFTVYIFSSPMVVLNSSDAVREALFKKGHITQDRPRHFILELNNNGRNGLGIADLPLWKEHRMFSQKVLHDLGIGKSVLEQKIQEEVAMLVSELHSYTNQSIDVAKSIGPAIANIVLGLLFGHRFFYDDDGYCGAIETMGKMLECTKELAPLNAIPWLQYLPGDMFAVKRSLQHSTKLKGWVTEQINSRKSEYDGVNLDDYISRYIKEKTELEADGRESTFTDLQLLHTIMDLFAAGTDTTKHVMLFLFAYLMQHPDVLQKVHREIDDVIGPHRPPCMKDKESMPYTEAVISEVLRLRPPVPLAVPHATTADVRICGKTIPKGTTLLPNLYHCHHDPHYWERPEEFDPERFLRTSDGSKGEIIPFSLGPRMCPGDVLAQMELFLFLTTLLQSFTISPPEGQPPPSTEGHLGFLLGCAPYEMVFKERSFDKMI